MQQTISLLPIALLALALTGCVEDKPAPRLDSPDRKERIEAVKEAQNRYGARAPAAPTVNKPTEPTSPVIMMEPLLFGGLAAGDGGNIVGRWDHSTGKDVNYFQFAADGTFKEVAKDNTTKGIWRLLSADTIEFSALKYSNPVLFFGPTIMEFKYHLHGDTFWLKGVHGWTLYAKATDTEKHP